MNFLQKIREALARFMQGRHGADNLSMATLIAGLVLSLLGSFTGWGVLTLLGLVLYGWTLFRMLSRNNEARIRENQKYLALTSGWKTSGSQFVRRLKNRKEFVYFKCPECKVLLRSKRGSGMKEITCPRCGKQFSHKA